MAFQPILSIHTWVSLPGDIREKIRELFSISRSSHVQVNDGRIETDGTTPQDFQSLTIEKMQAYLNSTETDFLKLFDDVVEKIKNPPISIVNSGIEILPDQVPAAIVKPTVKKEIKKKVVIKKKK